MNFWVSFTGFFTGLISAAVAIGGWLYANKAKFNEERRKTNIKHLISSYRVLSAWVHCKNIDDNQKKQIENALANIQLFGTNKSIKATIKFMESWKKGGNIEEVLNVLRDELRSELNLNKSEYALQFFRFD